MSRRKDIDFAIVNGPGESCRAYFMPKTAIAHRKTAMFWDHVPWFGPTLVCCEGHAGPIRGACA